LGHKGWQLEGPGKRWVPVACGSYMASYIQGAYWGSQSSKMLSSRILLPYGDDCSPSRGGRYVPSLWTWADSRTALTNRMEYHPGLLKLDVKGLAVPASFLWSTHSWDAPSLKPRKYTVRKVNRPHGEAMQKGTKPPQSTAPAEFPACGQHQPVGMGVRTLGQLSAQAIITWSRSQPGTKEIHIVIVLMH